MFTRKKVSENADPLQTLQAQVRGGVRGKRAPGANIPVKAGPTKAGVPKLKHVNTGHTKRAAFGDITNAKEKVHGGGKGLPVPVKAGCKPLAPNAIKVTKPVAAKKKEIKEEPSSSTDISLSQDSNSSGSSSQEAGFETKNRIRKNIEAGVPEDRIEEDFSFVVEDDDLLEGSPEKSLLSVDRENFMDVFNVGIYAQDIFDYYKRRERMFIIPQYFGTSICLITSTMRAILVDWLVEIQENFELNHETLYLAVKLCDMYLSRVQTEKETLQLLGAASVFIASKFDERCPPLIEDFTYVCDNAFTPEEFIEMEMKILKTIDFDLGIPISYRFLRRYSKVARLSMETLTLARFILEMSLMEHELIVERDSMLAAAALYIAMKMKREGEWDGEVVKASGYTKEQLKRLIVMLNTMLRAPPVSQLSTIRGKYSHVVFHEVAKIKPLPTESLL